ncbi:MAG: VWA domain-containing protein [Cytophagales bacterium]|nr:VWA domain-containing protein [Cytophagales bacterium]
MRRLPVYLLIDTSYSMKGEPLQAVQKGLETLVSDLKLNPYALETAYLSLITFSTHAQTLIPLSELIDFQIPTLEVEGTTSLGEALELVAVKSQLEVHKSTKEQKGDWKPLVFIMTDGEPTDYYEKGLAEFKKQSWGIVVACGAGDGVNFKVLKEITNNVIALEKADEASISEFFKWVSSSIGVSSTQVEASSNELSDMEELPAPPRGINLVK